MAFIKDNLQVIMAITNIIIAIGVIIGVISLINSIKNTSFNTIILCTSAYRKLCRKVQRTNYNKPSRKKERSIIIKDILGLYNDQLFYIKHKYVARTIRLEWLQSMYDILHNGFDNKSANSKKILKFHDSEIKLFPLVHEFWVNSQIISDKLSQKEIIRQLYRKHYRKIGF